jgi:hypothetical protein
VSSVLRPHRAAGWNVAVPAMIRDSAIPHAQAYPIRIRGQSTFFGKFGVRAPFDMAQNCGFWVLSAVSTKPFHAGEDVLFSIEQFLKNGV